MFNIANAAAGKMLPRFSKALVEEINDQRQRSLTETDPTKREGHIFVALQLEAVNNILTKLTK